MIGLQTAFSLACQLEHEIGLEGIIEKNGYQPKKNTWNRSSEINIEKAANLCLFNPTSEWILEETDVVSKSKNTPFIGKKLKGKIVAVLNNGF